MWDFHKDMNNDNEIVQAKETKETEPADKIKSYAEDQARLQQEIDDDVSHSAKARAIRSKERAQYEVEERAEREKRVQIEISEERKEDMLRDHEYELKAEELARKYNLTPAKLSFGSRGNARGAIEFNSDKAIWDRVYDKNHLLKVKKRGLRR